MRDKGVKKGDRILTLLPTSFDGAIAWCGCSILGAINVPTNVSYVGRILEHAINLTDPVMIMADARFVESLVGLEVHGRPSLLVSGEVAPSVRDSLQTSYTVGSMSELVGKAADETIVRTLDHDWPDIAALLFTSGTTGRSKAVTATWLHIYETVMAVFQGKHTSERDRLYVPWPIHHVSGAGSIYLMAIAGGQAVIREKWSTSAFMNDVYSYGCTMAVLMLEMTRLVEQMALPRDRGECPLERIFVVPTKPDPAKLMAKLGAKYCTDYNSTELSGPIVSVGYDPVPEGSAGKVRRGVEARIVDEDGEDVSVGTAGELVTRTVDPAAMSLGYWRMPEATAEAWRGGWFHTGDQLVLDEDGYFYFLGRMNDRIRHRGENVSAADLEAIVGECTGVLQCAAVATPAVDGEDDIVLYVSVKSGEVTERVVREFCDTNLPKFMQPKYIQFLDDFPMSPSGKIKKADLRARFADGHVATLTGSSSESRSVRP
jgi:crotonobetaine/carnitine-CoA ligase